MTHRSDLKPKTLGGIRWDKGKKSAVIWVLDPSDCRLPFPEMMNDRELTIVDSPRTRLTTAQRGQPQQRRAPG